MLFDNLFPAFLNSGGAILPGHSTVPAETIEVFNTSEGVPPRQLFESGTDPIRLLLLPLQVPVYGEPR